ncbi:ribosome-inactivating family protein [Spiroplasma endosymbiont of Notiophilus biguttatus]|uniref:ribosome-inactivating family protein n=1 Tax=Spiroplasma endosymbiont of Notiophilus biguttatus TaxID=3066285 RepID=UPI00313AE91C
MKYFSPSYWFKLWVLSAPLFNDKTQGINAKSIDNNQNIKDWASNNTNLQSINQDMIFINSSTNYQLYNLNEPQENQNIDSFYQTYLDSLASPELETSTHQHRHEKSKKNKRETNAGSMIEFEGHFLGVDGKVLISLKPQLWEEISFLYRDNNKEDFSKKFKNLMFEVPLWKDWRVENVPEDVKKLGEVIYDNFLTINNKFRNSSRRERIMIIIEKNKDFWTSNYSFAYKEANIRTDDSQYYPNKYIPNLISDFKTCIDPVDDTNDETILKAIKSKNPSVDTSQVYVKEKTINGKLVIGVKRYSNKYNVNNSASCNNFQVKPDLISDFKTCIDPVDDTNDETILKAIKSKNPSVDTSQVYVKEKTINGKLVIGVKSYSNKYNVNNSASCNNFQVKPDLISDFKTCIDPVDDTNDETILKAIKSKNPSVDTSQVYVKEKTINGKLVIGVKSYSNKYNVNNSASCNNFQVKPDLISDFKTCIDPVDDTNDETILKAIKSKNPSVDTSQVYVKEKTINGKLVIGVKSYSNKYNVNSSTSCNNFQVKPNLDKFINSLDPRISFLGSDMKQRGVLWLDTANKLIKFYPRTDDDGNQKTFGTYKNIIIKDQNDNTIRIITFNLNNTMSEVLNNHNLNSKKVPNDGLDYEDGYTIEITSSQADTTQLKRDECCNWYWNTSKGQHTEKLFIVNNWLWHKDYYLKKQRNEINLKRSLNLPTTFFQNNFYCKENNILTNINKETILDKSKIILSSAIDNNNNVYISTDNGVYKINFKKNENWKIPGFNNDLISKIILDASDNPYFISVNGNAYFLTNHWFWWNSVQRIDKYHNVPEIKNVLAIKSIKTNKKSNDNGVYFATNHGVFYMKSFSWTANKIGGINEIIVKISIDTSGNVYFISVNGNAYYITNTLTWTAERIDIKHNVPEIKNVLSINEIPNPSIVSTADGVYFATNHGVFYMKSFSWTANKIGGINEIIAEIAIDKNGNAYFTSVNGNAYYLANSWSWWSAVKIDDYYNVPEIKNVLTIKIDNNNVYYTTDHGVYTMPINNWTQIKKIDEINKIIAEITTSNNNLDCFKSFSSFENKENKKYEIKQNENPEIIVDDENEQTIKGIELLHTLQRGGDYGLVPVNTINRGYLNFVNSFDNVLRYFINQGIVTNNYDHETFRFQRGIPYRLTNSNGFFIVNVNIINLIQNRRLQLVFLSSNLYLQGFVIRNGNDYTSTGTYYYFRGDDIINDLRDPTLNSEILRFNAHYSGSGSMQSRYNNPNLNWNLITQSFRELLNYNSRTQLITIQNALTRVIFSTAESWRFNYLYTEMALVSTDRTLSFPWSNFDSNLTDWGTRSNFQGPLDIETIFDRNENFIDLRHLEHSFLSTLRIANSPSSSRRNKRSIFVENANLTNVELDSEKDLNNKNIFKWTDDFTKDINQEQHLSKITNNTNYIANNITNL